MGYNNPYKWTVTACCYICKEWFEGTSYHVSCPGCRKKKQEEETADEKE